MPANLKVPSFQIDNKTKLDSSTWYLSKAMGKNSISGILAKARNRIGFAGRKVAIPSVRKTGISHLLDATKTTYGYDANSIRIYQGGHRFRIS